MGLIGRRRMASDFLMTSATGAVMVDFLVTYLLLIGGGPPLTAFFPLDPRERDLFNEGPLELELLDDVALLEESDLRELLDNAPLLEEPDFRELLDDAPLLEESDFFATSDGCHSCACAPAPLC
jgi:hypothetical protein